VTYFNLGEICNCMFMETRLVKIYIGVGIVYFSFRVLYLWKCP